MLPTRRHVFTRLVAATAAGVAALRGGTGAAEAADGEVPKVAYHLSDLDKVAFVIGNIENHLEGVGGPELVTIALVVHGQALKSFHAASANPDVKQRVGRFSKAGLELAACGNTMKSQKVGLGDLLPGFISADTGGVVRIAELQSQGYLYLRP